MDERITKAFKALRAQGYIARQNFSCCRGCAGFEICTQLGDRTKKDPRVKDRTRGCVFYTRQDGANAVRSGRVYLSYGEMQVNGTTFGIPTADQGHEIVTALRAQGLTVEWDGNPDTRILVS